MIGSLKRALESPEARIALDLFRLYQGMETLIRKRGEAEGLSPSQVQTLLFLSHAHPRYKGIGAIAKRFSIAPATASRIVDNLEKKGLVERTRSEQDRRSVRVELTAAGKRAAGKITAIVSRLEGYVQGLAAGEQEALAKGLEEIPPRRVSRQLRALPLLPLLRGERLPPGAQAPPLPPHSRAAERAGELPRAIG
ncbi:MAG: MarR family winged helix-turn-helix transcriptional regulator [Candidatus Bipolaricaulia bacterium]